MSNGQTKNKTKKIENLSFCLFESVNAQFDNRSDTYNVILTPVSVLMVMPVIRV